MKSFSIIINEVFFICVWYIFLQATNNNIGFEITTFPFSDFHQFINGSVRPDEIPLDIKGQKISKEFFLVFNFSKK